MKLTAPGSLLLVAAALTACAQSDEPADATLPLDARADALSERDAVREGAVNPLRDATVPSDVVAPPADAMATPPTDATVAPEACAPTTCEARGLHCGTLDDGCGATLPCGSCTDPEVCGAASPGQCARPAPEPYPTRTAYRVKSLQPDFWPDYDEIAGNNTGGVAMNLVWDAWEPAVQAPPCGADQVTYGGHCYNVDHAVDDAIAQWSMRGLVVTAVTYGSPAWARARRNCTPVSAGYERFCAPDDPADFARFAGAIARRYDGHHGHGRVADFVVWNEVNSNDWFDYGCGQSAGACSTTRWLDEYAALYNAAFDSIAAEQPTARVLISLEHSFGASLDAPGNTASPLLSGETFLTGFGARVSPRAWHVAFHPYAPDLLSPVFGPDDYPRVTYGNPGVLLGWLRRAFPGVPSSWEVEFTESGVNSLAPRSSAAAQGPAVCDGFRNVLGTPGVDNYVYHRMVDHPVEVAGGLGLGLRNADHTPKPAWAVWALANRNDLTPPQLSCGFEDLPYTRLRRSYLASRGHWSSTRVAPSGFREENHWRLYHDAQPGSAMLYECRVGTHNLVTRDPGCEGQAPQGPLGYAFTAPTAGTVALYRCRVGAGTDHFVTTDAGCEGQTMDTLLGYVVP